MLDIVSAEKMSESIDVIIRNGLYLFREEGFTNFTEIFDLICEVHQEEIVKMVRNDQSLRNYMVEEIIKFNRD